MTDSRIAPDQVVGSEIADGLMVALPAGSPGVLLHQGTESDSGEVWDVVTIEACNIDSAQRTLFIGWGGISAAHQVVMTMNPREGRVPVVIKGRIKRGLPIHAWASSANLINAYVEVGVLDGQETV
jgi:hypothetical protein